MDSLSVEQRVEETPSIKEKLRLIAEGIDILLTRRPKAVTPKGERHLESADAQAVFKHWVSVMGYPNAQFTEGRRARIKARLKEGYAVDRMLRAIDGCAASDFHMGRDSLNARKYDSIDLIFRTGAKLEEFEAMPIRSRGGNRKFLGDT